MTAQWELLPYGKCQHKGFYNNGNAEEVLNKIAYTDYFDTEPNEEFPYGTADSLLRGSCQLFALSLSKMLGYQAYVIECIYTKRFHAFCQVSKDGQLYYIDARGVTTSFDEFMEVASFFVPGDYNIREVTSMDIEDWNSNEEYLKEARAFAEVIIKDYEENYRI